MEKYEDQIEKMNNCEHIYDHGEKSEYPFCIKCGLDTKYSEKSPIILTKEQACMFGIYKKTKGVHIVNLI